MQTMVIVAALFPVVLVGCLLPLLGRSRRGVLFGVTVPLEFAAGAEARLAVRRYRGGVGLLVLVVAMALLLAIALGRASALPVLSAVAVPVELVGAMLLWQRERARMKAHAAVVPLERSAELKPRAASAMLTVTAASLLPLVAAGLWLRAHWEQIPARWPQHWNAHGVVNGWGTRTPGSVYGPLWMGAPVVLVFVLVVGFMGTASGPQARQRQRFLAPLAAMAWAMSALLAGLALTPMMPGLGEDGTLLVVAAHMVLMLGILVWALWRGGMSGTDQALAAKEPYDGTPDGMWRAGGLIYYNPADAAVLVPKRMGMGWTLNFARPVAWCFLGGVVVLVVMSAVLPLVLGHGRR